MRIGFDAKRAVKNLTGLGNYSRLVTEELATQFPDFQFYLYTPELTKTQKESPRLARLNSLSNVEFRLPYGLGPLGHGALWRSAGITRHFRADGLDIYHGLSNELPFNLKSTGVPTVVTIHDLIYRRLPYCYPPLDRTIYNLKYGRSARAATRVIAISECTKRDLIELQGVDPEKIDVIYQGCDPQFKQVWSADRIAALRTRYNLPERYVLQVGTIERRKNLELTVRAMTALPEDIKLVAVGRDNAYLLPIRRMVRKLGLEHRFIHLQDVPFSDLPGIYQGAEIIAYPSHYEGFGIPVLEGLESRRPVVAATGSCLEEAGGRGAFYTNPKDPGQMAQIMRSILDGSAPVETHIGEGLHHAARFDTSLMASRLMETYLKAMDNV